jgi:hypothetical protein
MDIRGSEDLLKKMRDDFQTCQLISVNIQLLIAMNEKVYI